jgi:hypothetical protein
MQLAIINLNGVIKSVRKLKILLKIDHFFLLNLINLNI